LAFAQKDGRGKNRRRPLALSRRYRVCNERRRHAHRDLAVAQSQAFGFAALDVNELAAVQSGQ
jgi:hypothetical protein